MTGAFPALTVECSESGGFWRSWNQPRASERVAHREHVEGVLVAGRDGHRDALRFRLAEHAEAVDGADALDHADAGVDGELGEPEVALDAEVVERGPRGGHRQRRPGALHAGAGVEATEPVVEHEGLVAAQRLGAVEHHRRALRRVAELVQVGADRGDAVHPEVPRRHVVAELLDEREEEAAHAGVGVEAGARVGGQRPPARGSGRPRPAGTAGRCPPPAPCWARRACAMASTSARQSSRTGTLCRRIPK